MGKFIFTSLLCGFLSMGVSTAFGEETQTAPPNMLKAESQIDQHSLLSISEENMLTDEELDKVTGAGFGGLPEIPMFQIPTIPLAPEIPGIPEIPSSPEIPAIPEIPGIPEIPSIPEHPKIPSQTS